MTTLKDFPIKRKTIEALKMLKPETAIKYALNLLENTLKWKEEFERDLMKVLTDELWGKMISEETRKRILGEETCK